MQDKLTDLLQQRFSGHEAPVDPGAWDAISSGLGTASGETLRQAMQQKFSGHEMNVDPSVWNSISSQMGHGAGAGTGIGAGWMAAGVSALVVSAGLLWYGSQGPAATAETVQPVVKEQSVAQVPATSPENKATTTISSTPAEKEVRVADQKPAQISPQHSAPSQQPPVSDATPASASMPQEPATEPKHEEPKLSGPELVAAILAKENQQAEAVPDPAQPEPMHHIQPAEQASPKEEPQDDNTEASPDEVEEEPEVLPNDSKVEPTILIPNIFSPNSDGVNDFFMVSVTNVEPQRVSVQIFSAQSAVTVFTSNSLENMWKGTYPNGAPCETGNYFYAIEVVGPDGHSYTKRATVRLNRQ